MKAVRLLLNKKALWIGVAVLFLTPLIWLGWTQPWQYQPQVPTGPLLERTAERPMHPLPPEIQAAKDEGMRLWGLHEWVKMKPYLEEAANHGDPESMYFLGEAHRRLYGFSTAAMEWYTQAANAGDVYAMRRLVQAGVCVDGYDALVPQYCADDNQPWGRKAYQQLLPDAQEGDVIAMEDLFFIGGGTRWLRLAAEADSPRAQMQVGNYIMDGIYPGWPYYRYWSDDARLRAAMPWYRRAAELGYPPAMDRLAGSLYRLGEDEESWKWTIQAALHGVIERNLRIAACYINPQDIATLRCPVSKNVPKGYGILLSLKNSGIARNVESELKHFSDILDGLTTEEITQAEIYAQEWLEQLEAPFSEYPARWGI